MWLHLAIRKVRFVLYSRKQYVKIKFGIFLLVTNEEMDIEVGITPNPFSPQKLKGHFQPSNKITHLIKTFVVKSGPST